MRGAWGGWLIGVGLLVMPWNAAWAQACIGSPVQTDQTCTNSANLTDTSTVGADNAGLRDLATLTLINTVSGKISATLTTAAFGIHTAVDANVTNSGIISGATGAPFGGGFGIFALHDANVTNFGTISGTTTNTTGGAVGIRAFHDANVSNSGTISGTSTGTASASNIGRGIQADENVTVTNSGTISGTGGGAGGNGISSLRTTNVTNSGTISGTGGRAGIGILSTDANVTNTGVIFAIGTGTGGAVVAGISAGNDAIVINSGTISATATGQSGTGFGIRAFHAAHVTNSGTIIGTTAALQFVGNADTLTVLPGSRIIGAINLVGGGDTVNFRGGNHNLTFDTLAGATVTGTTPFVVSGNRAVAIDLTPFAANWRSLADFARGVSDAVPVFSGSVPGGGAPLAFAGTDSSSRFDDAFAAIPGVASAYAREAMVFKAPTAAYADGTTVWARGFAGQRTQQQDGVQLRNTNLFYGGMIGADFAARPDLRLGVFLGGGQTRSRIDLNQGGSDSDLLFGGGYARFDVGASFLHAAVQGGSSRNTTTRTINNNLVAGGIENATGSLSGWYVSPEATFGHRFALGQLADASYTLTPSVRIRYLYGSFDGYTETGTTAPLTIGGQNVSTLEERGELKLTRSVALNPQNQLSTSVFGGVLGTQLLGGNTINAALLGQAIAFATPGERNVWGGYGGLGLEWRTRNVTLFSAAEYLALSDNAHVVSGRAGLRVAF